MKAFILLISLFLLSCNNDEEIREQKFDKSKWLINENDQYPYRDKMVKDLIENVKIKGLKKEEVIGLLGEPGRIDSNYLFYIVDQKKFANTITLHQKTLVIKLLNDTVEWRKIKE